MEENKRIKKYDLQLNNGDFKVLATTYTEMLLTGDRNSAKALILKSVEEGVSVKDIYLHVFQPSQQEIGRLWQTNKINVAKEHFCTASTQFIMTQLYHLIFSMEKNGRQMVATCVSGELHELGIRMVADFFEMEGWDTYYLGANTPAESVVQTIEENNADILAISATMTFHINKVNELIQKVLSQLDGHKVKIIVGGRPFSLSPDLWKNVNANSYAPNAQEAIKVAEKLVLA